MAFDGLMTYTILNELKKTIVGGKVDKIFEPNPNELILGIYHNFTNYALNIVTTSNHYRMCLTTHTKANPNSAPSFCMVLRKYLLNTKITNISTLGLERLFIIEFEGHNKSCDFTPKKLIIELMGKHSNVILVNSNNVILDALKHFDINSNSYRNILPNCLYTLPISNKLDFFSIKNVEDFYSSILKYHSISENMLDEAIVENNYSSLSYMISNTFTGISKSSVLNFIRELGISDYFSQENCEKVYHYIESILYHTDDVCVNIDKNDFYLKLNSSCIPNDMISFDIDDYYFQKEHDETFITYRANLSRLILQHLKRLTNKLNTVNSKLQECKNTENYKLFGELITNNLYRISNIHQEYIEIENYYDNNHFIKIPLDKSITPSENAKRYFKKYHKLKNAKLIVESQKSEIERDINYLESIIYELQTAKTIEDIDEIYNEFSENFASSYIQKQNKKKENKKLSKNQKKKDGTIGEPIKTVIDGFTVLIGKNNRQNDYLTKQASPDDLWFHTKDIHGSHVILKTNQSTPTQETINSVAAITAFYSKASQSSNVPVDYTYAKYVKKPSKAKPGMVIYTNHKNVIVKPKKES